MKQRKAAERTAASILRNSRALFSPAIISVVGLNVTVNPFKGVQLRDPGPQRYQSVVNSEWLYNAAKTELSEKRPQVFLAFCLGLLGGLRRKEADLLMWKQVNLAAGHLRIERTQWFEPKTEESQRNIDLSPIAVDVLRQFMGQSDSEFVLQGGEPHPKGHPEYYRAGTTWRELIAWLRSKNVRNRMAIHMLRKESGSLVASDYGIEAARHHLGHSDIRVTSAHYVAKKRRIEVNLAGRVEPLRVIG